MKGLVLAAGKGTRLRPLTADKPKALVEIAGRPILSYCFEELAGLDITEIVVVVGYRAQRIIDRYGDSFEGIPLSYVRQAEPRGLADAIGSAEHMVTEPFVLLHGDYLFDGRDTQRCLDVFRKGEVDGTVLVEEVTPTEASEFGVCEFATDGSLIGLVEKPEDPPSYTVITGCFVFTPALFHASHLVTPSERGEYELTEAINVLLHAGYDIELVNARGWHLNVNTVRDVEVAENYLSEP